MHFSMWTYLRRNKTFSTILPDHKLALFWSSAECSQGMASPGCQAWQLLAPAQQFVFCRWLLSQVW